MILVFGFSFLVDKEKKEKKQRWKVFNGLPGYIGITWTEPEWANDYTLTFFELADVYKAHGPYRVDSITALIKLVNKNVKMLQVDICNSKKESIANDWITLHK